MAAIHHGRKRRMPHSNLMPSLMVGVLAQNILSILIVLEKSIGVKRVEAEEAHIKRNTVNRLLLTQKCQRHRLKKSAID